MNAAEHAARIVRAYRAVEAAPTRHNSKVRRAAVAEQTSTLRDAAAEGYGEVFDIKMFVSDCVTDIDYFSELEPRSDAATARVIELVTLYLAGNKRERL